MFTLPPPPPCVTSYVYVICHVLRVTWHMSYVTFFIFIFIESCFGQSGEASWWRVCHQRGYPSSFICLELCESQNSPHLADFLFVCHHNMQFEAIPTK